MNAILVIVLSGFAALAQVTIAPLFPLDAAVADVGLLALVLLSLLAGPKSAMVGLPLLALLTGFTSDRSPGLLILCYLPYLPVAYAFSQAQVPLPRFARIAVAALATGAWARALLGIVTFLQGAPFAPGELFAAIIIPGLALDALLVALLYVPCRLAGRTGGSLSLRRTGWVT